MFNRRNLLKLVTLFSGGAAVSIAASAPVSSASNKQRVAYHVSDRKKVGFALNNIRNHIKGVGGPQNVEIILVVHGPALKEFHVMDGNASVLGRMKALMTTGVEFNACGNTMRALKFQNQDIPEGMARVDQGGVVRLAELQQEGYLYLRP